MSHEISGAVVSIAQSIQRPKNTWLQEVFPKLASRVIPPMDEKEVERLVGDMDGVNHHSHSVTTFQVVKQQCSGSGQG